MRPCLLYACSYVTLPCRQAAAIRDLETKLSAEKEKASKVCAIYGIVVNGPAVVSTVPLLSSSLLGVMLLSCCPALVLPRSRFRLTEASVLFCSVLCCPPATCCCIPPFDPFTHSSIPVPFAGACVPPILILPFPRWGGASICVLSKPLGRRPPRTPRP